MEKPIFLARNVFIAASLSVFLLLVFFLFPPPPPPPMEMPSDIDYEIVQELHDKLSRLIADVGITGVSIPSTLPRERLEKLQKELARILEKTDYTRPCVQYALLARISGEYICFNTGNKIFLKKDEVWKYGKTINGEFGRYPNGLFDDRLYYKIEYSGTEMQCLIMEKIKIYSYIVQPENVRRSKTTDYPLLLRPPGNKIDR